MKARCDWCSSLKPIEQLNWALPEPGQESRFGAGRCKDLEPCNVARAAREQLGFELFACRLPGPSGCIQSFKTARGRNKHEVLHAKKRLKSAATGRRFR